MQDATPLPAIVLKGLEKYYPPPRTGIRADVQPFARAARPALQGVTFEVQEGEAVALLGYDEGSESGPAQTRLPRRKRSGHLSTAYRAARSFVLRPAQSLNARAKPHRGARRISPGRRTG